MKKIFFFLALFWSFASIVVASPSFNAKNGGTTIYYNITSSSAKTVEVTNSTGGGTTGGPYSGSVTIPSTVKNGSTTYKVTKIGENAFRGCTGLTSISIPSNVTTIAKLAFYSCTALTSLTIPSSVETIGYGAFSHCTSIKTLTLNKGLKSIGDYGFHTCSAIETLSLPSSLTTLGTGAFGSCTALKTATLAEGLITIGNNAFHNCLALETLSIPESVTTLGDYAFWICIKLQPCIKIPKNVTSIGKGCFARCLSLDSIVVDPANKYFCSSEEGVLFTKDMKTLIAYPAHSNRLVKYQIPEGVTSILYGAFTGCASLTAITLPTSLTTLQNSFVQWCPRLRYVDMTNSTSISISNISRLQDPDDDAENYFRHISANTLVYLPTNCSLSGKNYVNTQNSTYTCDTLALYDRAVYADGDIVVAIGSPKVGGYITVESDSVNRQSPCYGFDAPYAFSAKKSTFAARSVAFKKDVPSTICLPFGLTADEAASFGTFYAFSAFNAAKDTVEMVQVDEVAANTPYVFIPNADGVQISVTTPREVAAIKRDTIVGETAFKGIYTTKTWSAADFADHKIYGFAGLTSTNAEGATIAQGEFTQCSAGAFIRPFRAFLQLDKSANVREKVAVKFVGGDQTTGIRDISAAPADDTWHTLQGVRLAKRPTAEGIYIHNGKKVMIK